MGKEPEIDARVKVEGTGWRASARIKGPRSYIDDWEKVIEKIEKKHAADAMKGRG